MSDDWRLVYKGCDPDEEPLREALCTLGNGYFATRGAAEESSADNVHYPGTYIAGWYDRLVSRVGDRDVVNEDLVNFPNWLPVSFRVADGDWFGSPARDVEDFVQTLDLNAGLLTRSFTVRGPVYGSVHILTERFVSMRDSHLAAIRWSVTPKESMHQLQFRSALDGDVVNGGVARYRELRGDHIDVTALSEPAEDVISLRSRTKQASLEVSICARQRVLLDGVRIEERGEAYPRKHVIEWLSPRLSVEAGETVRFEKVVSLHTSRDPALGDLLQDGLLELARAPDFEELLARHRRSWSQLWDLFDVRVTVDPSAELAPHSIQRILRLHTFHLLQTSSPNSRSLDISIPARGWTGESYRGHIFWDEAYVLPFYISRSPEMARSLLLYRYRRLDEARAAATAAGHEGAMFPWQSGSSGREETQIIHLNPKSGSWDPDHSHLQRHVSAAIALDVWRYVQSTGDLVFLEDYGAEMLIEIARFWASLCTWNPDTKRFEIHGVMGPDEYHERYPDAAEGGLRNNVYTNVMVVWCMQRAQEALALLPQSVSARLRRRHGPSEEEWSRWNAIRDAMTLPIASNGLLEQFEGYDRLEELDWTGYRSKYGNIGRMDRILKAEGDSPDRYKLAKQADLCMLFYFLPQPTLQGILEPLGYELTPEIIRKTILYYRDRTSHGSTMSHLVFGAILAPYEPAAAWDHYVQALRSDVDDIQGGTTPEGIHTAVMAGTVRHVMERMAGISVQEGVLRIQPRLPTGIQQIECRHRVLDGSVKIRVASESVTVDAPPGTQQAVAAEIWGQPFSIGAGDRLEVSSPHEGRPVARDG